MGWLGQSRPPRTRHTHENCWQCAGVCGAVDDTLKINGLADLTQPAIKRIGIGDPKTVPAGHYATNYLDTEKILTAVKDKLVPLDNVRTVLTAVATDKCGHRRRLSHGCHDRKEGAHRVDGDGSATH